MTQVEKAKEKVALFLASINFKSSSDLESRLRSDSPDTSSEDMVASFTKEGIYLNVDFKVSPSDIFSNFNRKVEVDVNIPQAYIDTVALDNILKSVDEFMEASGFEYEAQEEPIYGSFFQKLLFLAKSPKTQEQVSDVLDKGKAALQAHYLNKPVAEATAQLSTAAAGLIAACNGIDEIVIRAGVLIL